MQLQIFDCSSLFIIGTKVTVILLTLSLYVRGDRDVLFKETDAGEFHMADFDVAWPGIDLLTCVIRCVQDFKSCYSVSYNTTRKLCIPGSWLVLQQAREFHPQATGIIYSTGARCDETREFRYYRKNDVTTCYWLTSNQKNYKDSKDTCKEKGANLYTIKFKEKLALLNELTTAHRQDLWIGLDASKKGVFRWGDDKTRLTDSLRNEIFQREELNNWTLTENCTYLSASGTIKNEGCEQTNAFVCEMDSFST